MATETGVCLSPGDWTPTGWGAMHRVRTSDPKWTELVCHLNGQRCETARIQRTAEEDERCYRCSALADLGPISPGPIGQVRRSSVGQIAIAHARVGDRRWKLIGEEDQPHAHGWRSDWDVAQWQAVGNAFDLRASELRGEQS